MEENIKLKRGEENMFVTSGKREGDQEFKDEGRKGKKEDA